ncbi:MAG: NADH-quinone oxidoreductase subunit NuoE [Sedimentisphaerales bacterium]|nr:NADH-quinone oxidoreductase subunit NuoE [Sedimentisphaerales bacterium]
MPVSSTSMADRIETILTRYPNGKRDALIPLLQDIQEDLGFLSRQAVLQVGRHLNLPASKIYGVATFYNQFRFEPQGRFHIQVCRGTACHVKGSAIVLETLQQHLGIGPNQTSRDGQFSLEVVACIGACGLAPVISINGEFFGGVTPEKIPDIIEAVRRQDQKDPDHDQHF